MDALAQKDAALITALKDGDEHAFARLIDDLSPGMLRTARVYVATDAAAQDLVRETWLAVIEGLGDFEGRSTLKSWIYRLLIDRARSPAGEAIVADLGPNQPALEPERFLAADRHLWASHWAMGPTAWPEDAFERKRTVRLIRETVKTLSDAQRYVVAMRDIAGCGAREVCDALGISAERQRVLLHRARSKVRATLEREFAAVEYTNPP